MGNAALVEPGGAVVVDGAGLGDVGGAQSLVAAVADDGLQLAYVHLVDEGVPAALGLHLVITPASEVDELQVTLLPILARHGGGLLLGHGVHGRAHALGLDGVPNGIGHLHFPSEPILFTERALPPAVLIAVGLGEGANPVLPGEVLVPGGELIVHCVVKLVGYVHAGEGFGVGLVVHAAVLAEGVRPLAYEGGVRPAEQRLNILPIVSQEVVGGGVGVLRCGKQVIPRLQDIGFGVHIVVGDKVLAVDGDGDGLGLARLELPSLFKAHQGDGGLLNVVGLVVIRVGRIEVNLHHIPASDRAGVLHGYAEFNIAVGVHLSHLKVRPRKGGIGDAVAKGVLHRGGVVVLPGIALAQSLVEVAGLIVLIAHVDSLVIEHGGLHVLPAVDQHHIPHILHSGGGERIVSEGVHQMAGGVDIAAEHIGDGTAGITPGAGGPQHRADVGVVGHPAQLEGVVGVDHQDHIVEGIVEVLNDLQFHGVRLQVMLILVLGHIGPLAHVAAQVPALAAGAGQEKHGDGALRLALGAVGDGGNGCLLDGPVLRAAVHDGAAAPGVCPMVVAVKLPQRLVDGKALLGKGGAHIAGDGGHAGAGAAGQQIHRGGGEQAQLGTRRHRQPPAALRPIVEEHKALRPRPAGVGLLGGLELFGVGDIPGVVVGIDIMARAALAEISLAEDVPENQVKPGGGHHGQHDGKRQKNCQQGRNDGGKRLRAQLFLVAFFFRHGKPS